MVSRSLETGLMYQDHMLQKTQPGAVAKPSGPFACSSSPGRCVLPSCRQSLRCPEMLRVLRGPYVTSRSTRLYKIVECSSHGYRSGIVRQRYRGCWERAADTGMYRHVSQHNGTLLFFPHIRDRDRMTVYITRDMPATLFPVT
jgi:hypothetical protein